MGRLQPEQLGRQMALKTTINIVSCRQIAKSVGWNGTGYSSTTTVSQRISPVGTNTDTKFGARWYGCAIDSTGINAADTINDPANASSGGP